METSVASSHKRPVNLTHGDVVVTQAKACTSNLSACAESLLAEFEMGESRPRDWTNC